MSRSGSFDYRSLLGDFRIREQSGEEISDVFPGAVVRHETDFDDNLKLTAKQNPNGRILAIRVPNDIGSV